MSSSDYTPGGDFLDPQKAYMAHFYKLFESYISSASQSPHDLINSSTNTSTLSKTNSKGLTKDTFECCLCGAVYASPSHLAQHNCPQMTRTAFQCKDCHKAFSCSANLASHQRWHRPKTAVSRRSHHQLQPASQFCRFDKTNFIDCEGNTNIKNSSSHRPPVVTAPFRAQLQNTPTNSRRMSSFSIDSILNSEGQKTPYACFRCDQKFCTQSDFEDHIIDHLLCTHN